MRVTLACDWWLKYTVSKAAAMARAGADVLLLCRDHAIEFGGDANERRATLEEAYDAGVTVLETPGQLWDLTAVPELLRLRRAIARFSPDVVHLHDYSVDPRVAQLVPKVPTVMTVHDPTLHPGQPRAREVRRWLLDAARRTMRARADLIVIHSQCLRDEIKLGPSQRCVVVPHGLYIKDEPLSRPPSPALGFFGRLEPYKGLDVLAAAMPRIWESRPEIKLRVAGKGPAEVPLSDPRVQVQRAYLPEARLGDFFGEVSLAVLPYTQASQTGAGSTAIGFGVPVVASRLGGLPDLVLDDSYLFDSGNDAALSEVVLRHIDDGADVRSRVLREIAEPNSWDSVGRQLLALYAELVEMR